MGFHLFGPPNPQKLNDDELFVLVKKTIDNKKGKVNYRLVHGPGKQDELKDYAVDIITDKGDVYLIAKISRYGFSAGEDFPYTIMSIMQQVRTKQID